MMKKLLLLAFSATTISSTQAAIIQFDLTGNGGAGLLGSNENGPVTGGGSGGEVGPGITFDDATNNLTINIAWGSGAGFSDLTGDITALHIHGFTSSNGFSENAGVQTGLSGFTASATNGGYSNTISLTSAQATGLLSNQTYINGHTAANGGGEIRGHLVQVVPEPSSTALLGLGALGLLLRRNKN